MLTVGTKNRRGRAQPVTRRTRSVGKPGPGQDARLYPTHGVSFELLCERVGIPADKIWATRYGLGDAKPPYFRGGFGS